jgi:hypothetical protein
LGWIWRFWLEVQQVSALPLTDIIEAGARVEAQLPLCERVLVGPSRGCGPERDLLHVAAGLRELDKDGTTAELWASLVCTRPQLDRAWKVATAELKDEMAARPTTEAALRQVSRQVADDPVAMLTAAPPSTIPTLPAISVTDFGQGGPARSYAPPGLESATDCASTELAARPADGPIDPFTDFVRHQRVLLLTLWGKGKVQLKAVLKAVYPSEFDDRLEALQQLIKRTNKKLAEQNTLKRYEVKRKGEFLELREA